MLEAPAERASAAAPRRDGVPRVARVPAADTAALAMQRKIESMSPTFRETSFLIAIRKAGYECNDVTGAVGVGDAHAAWRVTCREAAAYLVSIDAAGRLDVEPTPYGEAQPFSVIGPDDEQRLLPGPKPPLRPRR